MAEGSEFGRMAFECMQFRLQLPPRLRPAFALIEEAALKHALAKDIEREPAPVIPLRKAK